MTLRDTIHEVFPDLARLDCTPDYMVDAGQHDRNSLFEAWVRELDEAEAASLVEAHTKHWDDWQAGMKVFLATDHAVGLHAIRLRLMTHRWADIDDAIQGEWEIARDRRKYG